MDCNLLGWGEFCKTEKLKETDRSLIWNSRGFFLGGEGGGVGGVREIPVTREKGGMDNFWSYTFVMLQSLIGLQVYQHWIIGRYADPRN